jgi:hypothetical protein
VRPQHVTFQRCTMHSRSAQLEHPALGDAWVWRFGDPWSIVCVIVEYCPPLKVISKPIAIEAGTATTVTTAASTTAATAVVAD